MISRECLYGGRAVVTVKNPEGTSLTYRVVRNRRRPSCAVDASTATPPEAPWFGPGAQYTVYLVREGMRNLTVGTALPGGGVRPRTMGQIRRGSLRHAAIDWATHLVWHGAPVPEGYEITHDGRCSACRRVLRTEEEIAAGLTAGCARRVRERLEAGIARYIDVAHQEALHLWMDYEHDAAIQHQARMRQREREEAYQRQREEYQRQYRISQEQGAVARQSVLPDGGLTRNDIYRDYLGRIVVSDGYRMWQWREVTPGAGFGWAPLATA